MVGASYLLTGVWVEGGGRGLVPADVVEAFLKESPDVACHLKTNDNGMCGYTIDSTQD